MGKALIEVSPAARAVFEEADAALGEKLSTLILDGPAEDLKRTTHTQPAILTMSIACLRALEERGVKTAPACVAGHSLGEYSALVAAGAITFSDAVRAVRARGAFMQEAVPEGEGAMAAVLGLDAAKITALVAEASTPSTYVAVANYNGPEQTVIAGSRAGVDKAAEALKAAGAKRVLMLPVSAPFHCALMAPVRSRLGTILSDVPVAAPRMPVITNVEALPNSSAQRVADLLIAQVTAPVRFTEIVQGLLADNVNTTVEIGPGRVLSGIVKRMAPAGTVRLLNIEDPASLDATAAALSA